MKYADKANPSNRPKERLNWERSAGGSRKKHLKPHKTASERISASLKREKEHGEALVLKNNQLDALLRTCAYLTEGNDLSEQLSLITSTVREISGFRVVKVFVISDDVETMELMAGADSDAGDEKRAWQVTIPVREALGTMFRDEYRVSNSFVLPRLDALGIRSGTRDAAAALGLVETEGQKQSELGWTLLVPLYIRNRRLVGLIAAADPPDGKLPDADSIQLLEIFAAQAAIAVRNSRLYSRLREALKAKDEFLAVVSHELKTPLTSIMAYTQHLLQKLSASEENGALRSHLEVVNSQSRRMAKLVDEVLDVSALDGGTLVLQKEAMDLGEVVEASISKARAASSHRFTMERHAGPVTVFADQARIAQVVDGLLANAVKYSPNGGAIRVLLCVEITDAFVRISDEGVGIDKEHLPYIFERFYQADGNPRTRQFGGMGLGLYLSRKLVEAHGGRIWAESRKGQGSTFYFTLPLHQAESR